MAIAGQVINMSDANLFEEAVKLQLRLVRQRVLARQMLQQGQVERGREGQCSAHIDRRDGAERKTLAKSSRCTAVLFRPVDRGTRPASFPQWTRPRRPARMADCYTNWTVRYAGRQQGGWEGSNATRSCGGQPLYCGKSATFRHLPALACTASSSSPEPGGIEHASGSRGRTTAATAKERWRGGA